jgi:hypothetical protein
MADVNGDGMADVVGFAQRATRVALSTGHQFLTATNWSHELDNSDGFRGDRHPRLTADVNGDGKADAIVFADVGTFVSLSTGSKFLPLEKWTRSFGYTAGFRIDRHPRMMADVNGDGRDDIVAFGNNMIQVAISAGSRFDFSRKAFQVRGYGYANGWDIDGHPRLIADVNGDGRADILAFDELGVWVLLSEEDGFLPAELWSTDFAS